MSTVRYLQRLILMILVCICCEAMAADAPNKHVVVQHIQLGNCSKDCIDPEVKVSNSELMKYFPEIDPTDTIWRVETSTMISIVLIRYVPKVLTAHTERAKTLQCNQLDTLNCTLDIQTKYFIDDPEDAFIKDDSISLDTALLVATLYRAGKVMTEDGKPYKANDFQIRDMQESDGVFILDLVSGGCGGSMHARLEGDGDKRFLRVTQYPGLMCA